MRYKERSVYRRGAEAFLGAGLALTSFYSGIMAVLSIADAGEIVISKSLGESYAGFRPLAAQFILPEVVSKELDPYTHTNPDKLAANLLIFLGSGLTSVATGVGSYGMYRKITDSE